MVTRITFDLDDATRRQIAQKIDKEHGKRTRGRRLATRKEIVQYISDLCGDHLMTLHLEAGSGHEG